MDAVVRGMDVVVAWMWWCRGMDVVVQRYGCGGSMDERHGCGGERHGCGGAKAWMRW